MVAGLSYVRNYLDRETHDRLLAAVDQHRWQTSVDHRVQVYGYSYNRRQETAYRVGQLPYQRRSWGWRPPGWQEGA